MTCNSFEFGPFSLNGNDLTLREHGEKLPLNLKYAAVLHYLIRHSDQVVSKQELFDSVWQDAFVTDSALTQAIKEIRKALKDPAGKPKYIKTLPKRGYQFLARLKNIKKEEQGLSDIPFKFLNPFEKPETDFFFDRGNENLESEDNKARDLFQWTFQSYRQGHYLLDQEMLTNLLPQSKKWSLNEHGMRFLCESCLGNRQSIPVWIAEKFEGLQDLLTEKLKNDENSRVECLNSTAACSSEWTLNHLPPLLFTKQTRPVQRACVVALTSRFGTDFAKIIYQKKPQGLINWWYYLIALALARDENKNNINLYQRTFGASLFILMSLAWVRIRREKLKLAGTILGGTIGASFAVWLAGVIAGVFFYQISPFYLPGLSMLGLFIGACSGITFSAGFFISRSVAQRHSAFWSIPGSIIGCLFGFLWFQIGSNALLTQLLNIPSYPAIRWVDIIVLASVLSCSGLLFTQSLWKSSFAAALVGGVSGFLINLWGGNLFIRSTLHFINSFHQGDSITGIPENFPILYALLNPIETSLFGFFLFLGALLIQNGKQVSE